MQLTADLLGRKIARPCHFEMSCLGAAFVAGLGTGKEKHIIKPTMMSYKAFCIYLICTFLRPLNNQHDQIFASNSRLTSYVYAFIF